MNRIDQLLQQMIAETSQQVLPTVYSATMLAGLQELQGLTGAIAEQPDAWTPSGADYDRNIHRNPDAAAWADLFVATFPGLADKRDLMLGWFANAMMAMHDHLKAEQPDTVAVPRELLREAARRLEAHDAGGGSLEGATAADLRALLAGGAE